MGTSSTHEKVVAKSSTRSCNGYAHTTARRGELALTALAPFLPAVHYSGKRARRGLSSGDVSNLRAAYLKSPSRQSAAPGQPLGDANNRDGGTRVTDS